MANTLHLTGNASELDKLIQSFEFENQQHVKLIEAENQQISALEKELLNKKETISRLQEQISSFDEETKRAHKQFTINRDNVENLKKTAIVLKEHEEALQKKNAALIELGDKESKERSQILEHYKNIWRDYEAKYKSFPLAKTLQIVQTENRHLKELLQEKEKDSAKLREKLANFNDPNCHDLKNFKSFAVLIASMKLETDSILKECKDIALKSSERQEELQKAQMKPAQKAVLEVREQYNQQPDTPHTSHQIKTGACDDSLLISVFRQREDDETNVPMQESFSSQLVQENPSCRSPSRSVASAITYNQTSQEESMICSSAGERVKETDQDLSSGDKNMSKPKKVVNEQGDNEKTAFSRPLQQAMVQNSVPVLPNLKKRDPHTSPMMPKSYLPSLEEMRVKVAVPVQKTTQKHSTENSLRPQEIQMPSISKLSINQKAKVAPKGPAGSVPSSIARVSKVSISNQLGNHATASGPRTKKEFTAPIYEDSTHSSSNPNTVQMLDSEKEEQNPFIPTNGTSNDKIAVKANQNNQDIEMQEIEPSKTSSLPKTPKAHTITREANSAGSTSDSLQASVVSNGGLSPFDLAKHSKTIQMFHKSPGLPPGLYTSKLVFTSAPGTNTTSNSTPTNLGSQSKIAMQEKNAFGANEFNMQGTEPNQISGFREFNLSETGFSFNNSNDSTGSAGFNFGEPTDKSTEMTGFSFGNPFQFGGNPSTGDKCDNFLSVFESEKDGGQMESQETSFSFSFGGFQ